MTLNTLKTVKNIFLNQYYLKIYASEFNISYIGSVVIVFLWIVGIEENDILFGEYWMNSYESFIFWNT